MEEIVSCFGPGGLILEGKKGQKESPLDGSDRRYKKKQGVNESEKKFWGGVRKVIT